MTKISLNPQQKKASETLSGPVLILAGAGAGKTMTLTARIIKLILSGVLPQNILAITFTNKAAGEMKERILNAIEKNEKINFPVFDYNFIPFVSTFHALGVFIIRENYQKIGVSKYFSIYDRADMKRAIKESLKNLDLDPKEWEVKSIISLISKNKGDFIDEKKFEKTASGNFYTETMSKIWAEYEKIKRNDKALDFDDLLLETAKLLESNLDVREFYLKKWSYIHIDEYQDTNKVQYKITEFLTNPETQNIFVVGDDDQSIYGWRGSDVENILKFEKNFKNTKKVFMEQNYRSTKNIIEASNYVIEKNENRYPKKLFTESDFGEKIELHNAFSEKEEASFVAKNIKTILKKYKNESDESRKKNENDVAILYRSNFQSRILEEAMLRENISYQVLGTKFFDRAEVKDIVSYIRASKNRESLVDLKRIINSPKRGIGKTSIIKIFSANNIEDVSLPPKTMRAFLDFGNILDDIDTFIKSSDDVKMSDVVKFVIEKSGYESFLRDTKKDEDLERLSNIFELANFAEKYDIFETSVAFEKFLEDVALMSDSDSNNKEQNKKKPTVKLMTIHASKGLEFDGVFLTGCEQHFFSPTGSLDEKKNIQKAEEERRLFYVAMTRAKKFLFLSWASMRTVYGKTESNLICDFVNDIPKDFLEETSTFGGGFLEGGEEDVVYLEW